MSIICPRRDARRWRRRRYLMNRAERRTAKRNAATPRENAREHALARNRPRPRRVRSPARAAKIRSNAARKLVHPDPVPAFSYERPSALFETAPMDGVTEVMDGVTLEQLVLAKRRSELHFDAGLMQVRPVRALTNLVLATV